MLRLRHDAVMYMLRLVRMVRAARLASACGLVWASAACGAELPQEHESAAPAQPASATSAPPRVRGTKLAIQRRADGLEQVSLEGRPTHVTVARAARDGGVEHHCESEAP